MNPLLRRLGVVLAALLSAAGCANAPEAPRTTFEPDSIPEAFARSTAGLMWPGATRGWQITPEGNLSNGEWTVRAIATCGPDTAPPPPVIAFEQRWLPVAAWTRQGGDVAWRFEAVAFPEPAPRDSGLVVSLLVEATNRGPATREARLELALAPPDAEPVFVAYDAPEAPRPPLRWGSAGADTVYGFAEDARAGTVLASAWTLAPGQTRARRVLLPAYPTPAAALRRLATAGHARRVADVRAHWTEALDGATRFELGDPDVEDALRAARVLLLSCRERRGERWVPIGGPFHYRDVWLRDGARLIAALAVSGHTREARELADGLLLFQWPPGAFLSQRGQLDGTGQALWAFEQAFLRPAAADSVAPRATAALEAVRWCERQRDIGRRSGWAYGTMLPFADPRDAELVRAQLVGTDAWALAGYRAAARLLRAAGRGADASAVDSLGRRYRAEFAAALERTGHPDVPPSWAGVGRDWGNLAVGWPCMALDAGDPRLAGLARRVWNVAGGPGLVTYGPPDSLHGYVGADLGTWSLLAGRRADADRVLDALLHWRSASGAGAELFSRRGDFGRNPPPHPTSAAALVALVRNSLMFDDDDTLRLALGARARWWAGARVRGAPTRWGLLDLEIRRAASTAEWRWTPVPVWTSLTLPPGSVLGGDAASPLVRGSATVVLAPPGTGRAVVPIRSAGAPELGLPARAPLARKRPRRLSSRAAPAATSRACAPPRRRHRRAAPPRPRAPRRRSPEARWRGTRR